jgi:hypothetical protein
MMLKRVKPEFDIANNRPENPTGTEDIKGAGVSFAGMGGGSKPAGERSVPVMRGQ